jgi:YbbR domain-containing protein
MKNLLWNNWQAKLVSFLIALVIWVYVKNQFEQVGFIDQVISGTFTAGR